MNVAAAPPLITKPVVELNTCPVGPPGVLTISGLAGCGMPEAF